MFSGISQNAGIKEGVKKPLTDSATKSENKNYHYFLFIEKPTRHNFVAHQF